MKVILVVIIALTVSFAFPQSPDVRFRAAKQKETVEGDLRSAIRIYEEIADSKQSSRDLAAQALLRVGRCYEKLGSTESKKAYERVVHQYGDQTQLVGEARQRLASLLGAREARVELTVRLLSRVEEQYRSGFDLAGYLENVATDGHSIYRLGILNFWSNDAETSLVATDVATGRKRELFRGKFTPFGLSLSPDGRQLAFSTREWSSNNKTASIYTIGTDGSKPRRVFTTDAIRTIFMGPWFPNGRELAFVGRAIKAKTKSPIVIPSPTEIEVLSLNDGSVRPWTQLFRGSGIFTKTLSFSPDGQFLAYDVPSLGENGERCIHILKQGSSEASTLPVGEGSNKVLSWFPGGHDLLFASDRRGTFDAYRIRVLNGKAAGEASLVRTNIGAARSLGFDSSGTFYFINDGLTRTVYTAEFDSNTGFIKGSPTTITKNFVDWNFAPSWSPDGATLAYSNALNGMGGEVPFLTFRTVATNTERTPPHAPGLFASPPGSAWSVDSQYLYVERYGKDAHLSTYRVNVKSGETLRVAPSWCHYPVPGEQAFFCFPNASDLPKHPLRKYDSAAGAMVKLKELGEEIYPFAPSPDGKFILCADNNGKNLQLVPVDEGESRILLQSSGDERLAPLAWVSREKIGYARQRRGRISLWIRDVRTGAEVELRGVDLSKVAVSDELGMLMSFHPNGREVAWVSNEGQDELWALENLTTADRSARESNDRGDNRATHPGSGR